MAVSNSTDSCLACKFFITGGQLGSCHRFPQSLNKSPSDWCGEFIFANVARTKDEITPQPTIIDNLLESKPIQIDNKPKRIKK
ncbi:hypothetical protein UFOVP96_47 [uncultured Caudovirales phage]|uniref:Uncharacterized protein n=1 Tax=uncultured Caudovirales phage TaxID=2100421 RepID=A0A6J5KZ54_9CAUD|nr:hypothetical protein UFOVP96_47 [uncultured Caudovirales phage]